MTRRYALITAIPLLLSSTLSAQVSFGGEPYGVKAEKLGMNEAPLVQMPAVDALTLMAEDQEKLASGIKGPWRFGFNHAVDLSLENSGTWYTYPNGDRLWRVAIECPSAFSINFHFDQYVIPTGAKVFVYNTAGEWLGAFTAESAPGMTDMGVTQIAGDRITVEYFEPAAVEGLGQLHIDQVTHAYRDVLGLMKGLGDSGACNNNVNCPEGAPWEDQINSVAIITVGGSGVCTGQLINNCAQDGTPYFLTANHCTSGGVGGWTFRFNWQSPNCTPTTNGPTNQTVAGASLLVSSGGSDVALLQLNSTPPASYNVYYTGWDASGTTPANQTCIHHPSGDVKKISFDDDPAGPSTFGGAQCWRIFNWEDGTTEPGSSGSGLWDQNHRLIGQLFGGTASCSNNIDDYFGRFNVSFPLVDNWLDPLGSCGTTLDGYDPSGAPADLDASVQSIDGVDASYCNVNSINPGATIKNVGLTTLTSLTILYDLDGGPNTTYNWSGSLATNATASVNLSTIPAGNGSHVLTVTCTAPNGGTDLNTANDTKTAAFTVASPGTMVTLAITLDDYGSETTWELQNSGGTTIYSGGPYADGMDQTVITEQWCLGAGCYNLVMTDDYGDGICCAYGNGHYEVTGQFGTNYVTGNGLFTDEITHNFCVTNVGIDEQNSGDVLDLWPNPTEGTVQVALAQGTNAAELEVFDATGRRVHATRTTGTLVVLELGTLSDGAYSLRVTMDGRRSMRHFVVQR